MSLWWWLGIALVAFLIFRAGRNYEREVAKQGIADAKADEQILGCLGPIAGEIVAGRMTPEKADAEARKSEMIAPGAWDHWQAMSQAEKDELGRNMLLLYDDPAFNARMDRHLAPLSEAASKMNAEDFPEDVREDTRLALDGLKSRRGREEPPSD